MGHAIYRLDHDAHGVRFVWHVVVSEPSRRRRTVDYFAGEKVPLQIRGDEVPTAQIVASGGGDRGDGAQRSGAHGSAEGLIVVNALHLGAPLDAQARLFRAVSFDLVHPSELHKVATTRLR